MTHIGTLWGDIRQGQTKVILSVATLNEFELDLPPYSFQDKPADFLEKFPYGKIPAFESTNGFKLVEGIPIARYVSSIGRVNLLGANAEDAAIVDQWVHYAEHEIFGPTSNIAGLIYEVYTPFSRETLDKNKNRLVRALRNLEKHLEEHAGYVALDRLTLADLVVASVIYVAAGLTLGDTERKKFARIFSHYDKVTGDEKIKKYWGTDKFVDEAMTEPTRRPYPVS